MAKPGVVVGSLADLASMQGMPREPTLRKLIADHDDFPLLSRGTNGRAYEFNLADAFQFVRGLQQREEDAARAKREAVNQLTLGLLGDDSLADETVSRGLSPAEQAAAYQAEIMRIKLAREKGELVKADEMEAALGELAVWMRDALTSLSSKCSRRLTFSRDQLAVIDAVAEAQLIALADRMERVIDNVAVATDAATLAAVPARE